MKRDIVYLIIYILAFLAVLALHYTVPYTLLKNAKDFSLYLFWVLLSVSWIIVSILYMNYRVKSYA